MCQVALSVGDDQLRPTLPSDTPEPVTNVALACFDPEPENRPSFALIAHHLRQVGDTAFPGYCLHVVWSSHNCMMQRKVL